MVFEIITIERCIGEEYSFVQANIILHCIWDIENDIGKPTKLRFWQNKQILACRFAIII